MGLRIAVIGYGSLPNQLTNHGATLQVKAPPEAFPLGTNLSSLSPFRPAGLSLPVLLGRVSGADTDARRITMILHPGARDVPVFYAESQYGILWSAIENLQKREGCTQASAIGYVLASSGESRSKIPEVARKVRQWAQSKGFDAVIWTDLPAKGVVFGQFPTGREILPLLAQDPVLLRNTQAYIDNLAQSNIPLHHEILRMDPPTIVPSSSSSTAATPVPSTAVSSHSTPDASRRSPPAARSSDSFWTRRMLIGLPLLVLSLATIFWVTKRYFPGTDSSKS